MILNALPELKYLPRVIRIFFSPSSLPGPPATLDGVKSDFLAVRLGEPAARRCHLHFSQEKPNQHDLDKTQTFVLSSFVLIRKSSFS